jgi:hypothetical protein
MWKMAETFRMVSCVRGGGQGTSFTICVMIHPLEFEITMTHDRSTFHSQVMLFSSERVSAKRKKPPTDMPPSTESQVHPMISNLLAVNKKARLCTQEAFANTHSNLPLDIFRVTTQPCTVRSSLPMKCPMPNFSSISHI